MKIKNKIMLNTSAILIIVMVISTITVSYLITNQNRKASNDLLKKSFNIIRQEIKTSANNLLSSSRQMAATNGMPDKIQLLFSEKESDDMVLTESVYHEVVSSLYNLGQSTDISRIRVYDMDGDLVAFLKIGKEAILMGYTQKDLGAPFKLAKISKGMELKPDSWKNSVSIPGIELKYEGKVTETEFIHMKKLDAFMGLVVQTGSYGLDFNEKTEQLEPIQVGIIVAEQKLGNRFVNGLSRLTETEINIFSSQNLSVGTLPGYTTIDLASYQKKNNEWDIALQAISYKDISVDGKVFFQSILPIYKEGTCIGAISSLFSKDVANANTLQMIHVLILVAALCIVLFLPAAYFFADSLSKPIVRVKEFAGKLKNGDLSTKLPEGNDEMGEMGTALNAVVDDMKAKTDIALSISNGNLDHNVSIASKEDKLGLGLQTMVLNLNKIVSELLESANQVDAGSSYISVSSQTLSDAAIEQASALQQITRSMQDISSQTQTNAENATQANQFSDIARDSSQNGVRQMGEMVVAMHEISDSSKQIAKIIKTIDDIAFQTNLLSLNAAVEAARAGKHGKGFAVVAQEVRSLASRSAKAAQETSVLIETAVKKIQNGNTIAEKNTKALEKIFESIAKVADLVGDIATASNEQATGISQVNIGLSQVDNVTQMNTVNSQKTFSAAEKLSSQAAQVRSLLTTFNLKINSEEKELVVKRLTYPSEKLDPEEF